MTFRVYEEDLAEVRGEAIAALNATREGLLSERRFDWLYRENPDGDAILWTVRTDKGEMAGFTVAIPRRVLVEGDERVCWIGADFSIYPKFRALGVALKLRRAAKDAIDAGRVSFLYSHPNDKMRIIHQRVGHSLVGRMDRYARPLRSEPYLRRRFGGKLLLSVAGKIIDPVLGAYSADSRHRHVHSTRIDKSPSFDHRFDALFYRHADQRSILGVRDSRYLNWRYRQNPLYQTHAVLAEKGNELIGYALFTLQNSFLQVKDVFASGDEEVEHDLLARLIDHARALKQTSISISMLEGHPLIAILEQFGFVRREDSTEMFAYAAASDAVRELIRTPAYWFISAGDRDV